MVRVARPREGGKGGAHLVLQCVSVLAGAGHRRPEIDVFEHERDVQGVEGLELAVPDGRPPREVVHEDRRLTLIGLSLSHGHHAVAEAAVRRRNEIQVQVGDARPALAISGDERIDGRIIGADSLLDPIVQRRIVHLVERRIAVERDFGLGRADEQRNRGAQWRGDWIERARWDRPAVDDGREVQPATSRSTATAGTATTGDGAARSWALHGHQNLVHRHLVQLVDLRGLEVQSGEERFGRFGGLVARRPVDERPAHRDGSMEQSLC